MAAKRTQSLFTDETAKFNLYLKTREIQQITKALQKVIRLPKKQREVWVQEHGDFLAAEFEAFVSDSNMTFEGLSMDDETLELSRDLVFSLREAFSTVHGMLHTSAEVES